MSAFCGHLGKTISVGVGGDKGQVEVNEEELGGETVDLGSYRHTGNLPKHQFS